MTSRINGASRSTDIDDFPLQRLSKPLVAIKTEPMPIPLRRQVMWPGEMRLAPLPPRLKPLCWSPQATMYETPPDLPPLPLRPSQAGVGLDRQPRPPSLGGPQPPPPAPHREGTSWSLDAPGHGGLTVAKK